MFHPLASPTIKFISSLKRRSVSGTFMLILLLFQTIYSLRIKTWETARFVLSQWFRFYTHRPLRELDNRCFCKWRHCVLALVVLSGVFVQVNVSFYGTVSMLRATRGATTCMDSVKFIFSVYLLFNVLRFLSVPDTFCNFCHPGFTYK